MLKWSSPRFIGRARIGCGLLALIALIAAESARERRKFDDYRAAHHCQAQGKIDPSNGYGFSSSGKFVATYEPGKTIWICDGGEMRIR